MKTTHETTVAKREAGHTPGPWKAAGLAIYAPSKTNAEFSGRLRDFVQPVAIVDGDAGYLDAELHTDPIDGVTSRIPGWEEANANARLIAAAPELLTAAKRFLQSIADNPEARRAIADACPQASEDLYAAIAKATGGNA